MTGTPATASQRHEYDRVVGAAGEWARARADVVGLAVIGSWARGAARVDSDIDILVLTTDPTTYVEGESWISGALGEEAPVIATRRWGPLVERRVLLASGTEIEWGFATPHWASTSPLDPGTANVIRDGCIAVHDPDRIFEHLVSQVGRSPEVPTRVRPDHNQEA